MVSLFKTSLSKYSGLMYHIHLIIIKIQFPYHLTSPFRLYHQKVNNNSCGAVDKREPSYIVFGNVNWYTHYGEQYGCSSKVKNRNAILSSNPIPGHIFRENHNYKRYMQPNVHWSIIYNSHNSGRNLKIHWQRNG